MPELTQRQFRYQYSKLHKLVKSLDVFFNRDGSSDDEHEKYLDYPSCNEVFDYIKSNEIPELPKFRFIASGNDAEKLALGFIKANYDFSNVNPHNFNVSAYDSTLYGYEYYKGLEVMAFLIIYNFTTIESSFLM